ncbi:MAG: T9SS type A sorting domain-containing protein [Saprospiraceae bacterium]|nr:T9SS type A sorting domain-containing protein [Saprospiraceae bacterium]
MPFFSLRAVFGFLFLLCLSQLSAQNCNPDVTAPTMICNEVVYVSLSATGTMTVSVDIVDNASYDACCLDTLLIRRQNDGPCDSDTQPDDFAAEIPVCCADLGQTFSVVLRAYDCAGNMNECLTEIIVEDKLKPVCLAPANVTVTCDNFDESLAAYGVPSTSDNCCIDTVTTTLLTGLFDTVCNKGTLTRLFKTYDCNGNSSQCSQKIVVNYNQQYFVKFPNDTIASIYTANAQAPAGEPEFYGVDCELMGVSYSDQVFTNVPGVDFYIQRTWTIINWCTYNPNNPITTVPNPMPELNDTDPANLPGPVVSAAGTTGPWAPTVVKILPTDPSPTNYSTFYDANVNGYQYIQHLWLSLVPPATVTGYVFVDTLQNCDRDAGEPQLVNWVVQATGQVTGQVYTTHTVANGSYQLSIPANDTIVEISLQAPFNYGQSCPSTYTLDVESNQAFLQDIPVQLEPGCPLLSTDLATPFLRRCLINANTYTVQACNLSTVTVEDTHVEVQLDDYLDYGSSSLPADSIGPNLYSFATGDLAPGECQVFTIVFTVNCDAPLNFTHCSEAHIYPDSICDPQANWSGAEIQVSGYCDGDSVRLTIANVGTGNMTEMADFVVVEDVIMYRNGNFQLNAGAVETFSMPANGATWRLEAEQEVTYPWTGVQAVAVEGCGGLNETGLVTLFPLNSSNPFVATDCQENMGSFDPNDKQAFPRGYGAEHLLEANTDLDYLIRFQNTGTDTAFTVVVLDTLSAYLDASAVRPGAASHAYEFAVLDGNVLRFTFNHILLPDSNVNEAASHGFVKFRIPQVADNPNGTVIENSAAIYFDLNDPVITNTTFHTIGDHFVLVSTDQAPAANALKVYPNPAGASAWFELPKATVDAVFQLQDQLGKTVRRTSFSGGGYRFERGTLPSGIYFYQINLDGGAVFSGKVLLR